MKKVNINKIINFSLIFVLITSIVASALSGVVDTNKAHANPESIADVIEAHTIPGRKVDVTVNGEQYAIVTLDCYINPETLQCSNPPQSLNTYEVYVDAQGYPVSDFETIFTTTPTPTCGWSEVHSTTHMLMGVWGSSSDDVFAVGDDGDIWRYDGSIWEEMSSGTTGLLDVWGSSSSDVFAVGFGGKIWHYDGSSWGEMTGSFPSSLRGVWGCSPNNVFAVGFDGEIWHYDGNSWSEMVSPSNPLSLYGVWGSSCDNVFAVGWGGMILHYDGNIWSSMASGTTSTLEGVWGTSSDDIFVVGWDSTILHYSGSTWQVMPSNAVHGLTGVWGSSSEDVFAIGSYGTILHYDGSNWAQMDSNTEAHLRGIWGTSSDDIFVVGDDSSNGSILHYCDPLIFELVSIALTPAGPAINLGETQQFTATGTYSDASTADITATATWVSSNTAVATIDAAGLATSMAAGTTGITASQAGITSPSQTLTVNPAVLVSIAVTPAGPAINLGQTQQFTATGTYSDASTADITATASWASSNTAVATIDAAGLATSVAAGTTGITASQAGITSPSQTLTVNPAVLVSIAVTPGSPAINLGETQQFTATGTYSDAGTADISATATWVSSNTAVATIDAGGLATSVTAGTTGITASQAGITSPSQTLTVEDTVVVDLSLTAGWNMVSVPVTPADNSVGVVFPGVAGTFTWNATSGSYYMPIVIEPEKGYWVAVLEDTVVSISGTPVETWTTDIEAGWNMIGSIINVASIADPNDNPDGCVLPWAYGWDPVGRAYTITTDIEPGKGYWVASLCDCTLTLP